MLGLRQIVFFLFLGVSTWSFSQDNFQLPSHKKQDKIKFQLVNNMILLPVKVNGVPLTFLLDTGASSSVIFSFEALDTLKLNNSTVIQLRGLSKEQPIDALKSEGNSVEIGKSKHNNMTIYVVFDGILNFTSRLGVPIHGIIGGDFLKDFVVAVNYKTERLKIIKREFYKPKNNSKDLVIPLEFRTGKPYFNAVYTENGNRKQVKLLIDSGSGDALWLFDDEEREINIPEKAFDDYLGLGINGDIYGKRFKVDQLEIADFTFTNVNTAFPEINFLKTQFLSNIDGSIGGEILKRFHFVIDYANQTLALRKNSNYNAPFHYNMSGITLEHGDLTVFKERQNQLSNLNHNETSNSVFIPSYDTYSVKLLPRYVVTEIRKNSPADRAGILLGDEIIEINNESVHKYKLYEINSMFYTKEGKTLHLKIQRGFVEKKVKFVLEDL